MGRSVFLVERRAYAVRMDGLSRSRYVLDAFPPYRFVPGLFPHPTAHAQGHSYRAPGMHPPRGVLPKPEDWATCPVYLLGADLYNYGYWWEAHEKWESIWQETQKDGVQGRFLQGLIQVAACHLKWHMGHLDGVRRLLTTSALHLNFVSVSEFESSYMGLGVTDFCLRTAHYYQSLFRLEQRSLHDPSQYPYLILKT